jgi:catechol 2,3-dioxygenase-like lactoylglutathione lyase family enzyme
MVAQRGLPRPCDSRRRAKIELVEPLRVVAMDHIVLRCGDVATTLRWYLDVLGLAPVRVEAWERGDAPFPSARVDPGTIIDFVARGEEPVAAGHLDHLCLVIEPTDMAALGDTFRVVDGPATRYGARGNGTSVYVLDPDDTVVELRHY